MTAVSTPFPFAGGASSRAEGLIRWRPVRLLLLNIHNYGAQEMLFSRDGRLLLRGANGSGKSTALEACLPFLFEGDLGRLSASTGGTRSWRTSLLPRADMTKRIGHVALEFVRDGRFLTLGACLSYQRGTTDVQKLFYVTERRVAVSATRTLLPATAREALLLLSTPDGPTTIKELRDAQGVEHVAGRDAWQTLVNRRLFGFRADDDLRQHLRTMHTVRNIAHAIEKEDIEQVSASLLAGLPEIDADRIQEVKDGLDGVRRYQHALREAEEATRTLGALLGSYGEYVARAVRERSDALLAADATQDQAREALLHDAGEHEQAESARHEADEELRLARTERDAADAALRQLHQTPGAGAALRLSELRGRAAQDARAAAAAADRLAAAGRAVAEAQQFHEEQVAQLAAVESERHEAVAGARSALAVAGALDCEQVDAIEGAVRTRITQVAEQRRLRAAQQRARDEYAGAAAEAERLGAIAERADAAVLATERDLAQARQELIDRTAEWAARQPLALSGDRAMALAEAFVRDGSDALGDRLAALDRELAQELGVLVERRLGMSAALDALRAEREQVAERGGPPVRQPAWLTAVDRQALWQAVDFADELDDARRDELESALEASGLLFASLGPASDGMATVRARPLPAGTRTLAEVLVCEAGCEAWAPVLESIAVGASPGAPVTIDAGTWLAGPLTVKPLSRPARLIGAAARERSRLAELARLDVRLAELEADLEVIRCETARVRARQEATAQQRRDRPSGDVVETAARRDAAARSAALGARDAAATASRSAQALIERVASTEQACTRHAAEHHVGGDLLVVDAALDDVVEHLRSARGAMRELARFEPVAARASRQLKTARDAAAAVAGEAQELDRRVAASASALQASEAADGATAAQFAVQLRAAEQRASVAKQREERTSDARVDAAERLERAKAKHTTAETRLTRAQGDLRDRSAAFIACDSAGLLAVVAGRLQGVIDAPEGDDDGLIGGREPLDVAAAIAAATHRFPATDPVRHRRAVETAVSQAPSSLRLGHTTVAGDLLWVSAAGAAGERSLRQLAAEASADRERYHKLLTDEQRRIVQEHLMRDLAGELQRRLDQADRHIASQNAVLADKRTSSGVAIELDLVERDDLEPELVELHRRLAPRHGSVDAYLDDDRKALAEAFERVLDLARSDYWQERGGLETLLDYRSWLHIDQYDIGIIARRQGKQRIKISRHTKGLSSGGEKAWMIYMPLLAALSAQADRSAFGPKLLPMDEALMKVDASGAAEFFAALDAFQMSCLLTSEKLIPTAPRVGTLSSYDCETVEEDIVVSHWHWDAGSHQKTYDQAEALAAELLA
jgi:hypothetical protein